MAIALETYVRKRVYLIDEGIYYIGKIYRFRMMANFEVRSGIVQNIRILMNDKEKLEVSKKMGVYIKRCIMMNGKSKRKEKENDSFIFVGSGWDFDS